MTPLYCIRNKLTLRGIYKKRAFDFGTFFLKKELIYQSIQDYVKKQSRKEKSKKVEQKKSIIPTL